MKVRWTKQVPVTHCKGRVQRDRASRVFARIERVVDTKHHIVGLHSGAGRGSTARPHDRGSDG
jgi:hypothetical protein